MTEAKIPTWKRNIPNGRGGFRKWTQEEYEDILKVECAVRGYDYRGFVEPWNGVTTKLKLHCTKDGNTWDTTVANSFLMGHGCPECKARIGAEKRTQPVEKATRLFMSSGKFKEGTEFFRSYKKPHDWYYTCPICSNDEYVKEGLCSGKFYSTRTNLTNGGLACRCSDKFKWNKAQREYQINKINYEESKGYKFVQWLTEFTTKKKSRAIMSCELHGEWDVSVGSYLGERGTRCPDCSQNGYNTNKDGYVYIIKVKGGEGFVGYGISNKPLDRLRCHASTLAKVAMSIENHSVFKTTGPCALMIENRIKKEFVMNPQAVKGFKTEATYLDQYEQLLTFVSGHDNVVPYLTEVKKK